MLKKSISISVIKYFLFAKRKVYCFTKRDQTSDVYVEYIIEMDLESA